MLAQSFKTAAELKISDEQYDALKMTLVMFETTSIPHFDEQDGGLLSGGDSFNLTVWSSGCYAYDPANARLMSRCGTVRCIGGWAEHLSGVYFNNYPIHYGLNSLFNPHSIDQEKATPEHAARALRNYLTTGHPRWREVIRNP